MDKLIDLRIQASLLRVDIRAARLALQDHERKAKTLRSALGRCERALVTLKALLEP